MQELIRHIAMALVEDPSSVEVKELDFVFVHGAGGSPCRLQLLELHVGSDDLGKVIGKQGRTARAMRSLLAAATAGSGKDIRLEIVE